MLQFDFVTSVDSDNAQSFICIFVKFYYCIYMFYVSGKESARALNNLQKELSGFLRADQLDALEYQSKTSRKWYSHLIQLLMLLLLLLLIY